MKYKDIQKLKTDEFEKKYTELNSELIKLNGQSATGTPPKSPGQIRQIKRTIARFNTIKAQKGADPKMGTMKVSGTTGGKKA